MVNIMEIQRSEVVKEIALNVIKDPYARWMASWAWVIGVIHWVSHIGFRNTINNHKEWTECVKARELITSLLHESDALILPTGISDIVWVTLFYLAVVLARKYRKRNS